MAGLKQWLDDNGLDYRIDYANSGVTTFIFTPPPGREDCHASAICDTNELGRAEAKRLRGWGWAVRIARDGGKASDAIKWLQFLGYGRDENGQPLLHLPKNPRDFGRPGIDLVRVAEAIMRDPGISTRDLAAHLSLVQGRRIERQAVNRAMMAVGWGPEERQAFNAGTLMAPRLSRG